ncbi:MAG: hypothetical protein M3Z56_04485 [Bacteroidota bacterium]|nr:hypothetical protein [Bacteroidota bacterium]
MKFWMILCCILCCALVAKTQEASYADVDRIALNIPSAQTNTTSGIASYINKHFDTDSKKVRAIYTWVASNIKYDAAHLHRVILDADREQKVTYAMERKRGVCENFAAIFTDICVKCGLRAYVIEGYTKQAGFIERAGHAWSAVYINNDWYLYDPTWDAGFKDGAHSISESNTNYFQAVPSEFIDTHMPFDPMFQFLDHPVSYEQFSKGYVKNNNSNSYFNYRDSISKYEKMDSLSRYLAAASRIEKNGNPSSLTSTKLKQLKMETEIIYQDKDVDLYNAAIADYKNAVGNFKTFLNYRNNRFLPSKPMNETEAMLDNISNEITVAVNKLKEVNKSKATLTLDTGDIEKMLSDLSVKVKEQQIFLKNYPGTTKEK